MAFNRHVALLQTITITAFVAVVCGVVHRFVPYWQPLYVVAAFGLVALEATVVQHSLHQERMWSTDVLRYLIPELLVLAVLVRVALTLSFGIEPFSSESWNWVRDPLSAFDGPFVAGMLGGLAVGWFSHRAMHDVVALGPRVAEVRAPLADVGGQMWAAEERRGALQRIGSRFVFGGVAVLLCLAVETVNIQQLAGQHPASITSTSAALIYLVGGFLLYSQARLALLQSRWQLEGAVVGATVAHHWTRTSWLLVGGVALAAWLLPRTYGFGLLDSLRLLIHYIGYGLAFVGSVFVWVFGLLLLIPAWVMAQFSTPDMPLDVPPIAPMAPPPPVSPPSAVAEPQLWAGLLFWACMLLLVAYAALIVLQRRPGLVRMVKHWPRVGELLTWLRRLRDDTRLWVTHVVSVTQPGRRVFRSARSQPSRPVHGQTPRALVQHYYRATLQQAAQRGWSRRNSQTPYEYQAALSQHRPDIQSELTEMTDAFVQAAYSPREVQPAVAQRVRRMWARVQRMLRQ